MLTQTAETKSKYDVHHEGMKDTKDLGINSLTPNFGLFATFVVKTQVRLWLRLGRVFCPVCFLPLTVTAYLARRLLVKPMALASGGMGPNLSIVSASVAEISRQKEC
jgi:hypothetical protein